jgi:DNA-binding transcriptional regulator LsrR (DeoR family)
VAGVYKHSATQQAEAIKMIRVGEKSQAEIAELFNVDRSTISRLMKEAREKELVKSVR